MKNAYELKQQLSKIKDDEWRILKDMDRYPLALEMMENIGSTDPVLRDDLILEVLYRMITEDQITNGECRELLKLAFSEKHLFLHLGKTEDDSVFNRAFSVLIIRWILFRHNHTEGGLFTGQEIKWIHHELLRYSREEKDVRGYVAAKGWAHSAAHTSDALKEIALCSDLNHSDLMQILNAIQEKLCVDYHTYVNFEEDRMVNAVMNVIGRGMIREEELTEWLRSFEKIEIPDSYPAAHVVMTHRRNFLSSLYFRLKRRSNFDTLIGVINEAIDNITPNYFK